MSLLHILSPLGNIAGQKATFPVFRTTPYPDASSPAARLPNPQARRLEGLRFKVTLEPLPQVA
jgi:hypothetical protein